MVMLQQVKRTPRVPRRPQHRFYLETRPWQIQPMLIAPVLPGETMKNLLLQSRVVSDPLLAPLVGWWCEYYFFYVKHRDMDGRDDFSEMVLDKDKDLSAYRQTTAYDQQLYTPLGGIKWVEQCLNRVVDQYFRDEGEESQTFEIDGLPAAWIAQDAFYQSGGNAADFSTSGYDLDVDLDADSTVTASEIEKAMRQFEFLRANGVTDMSYEDYLSSFGLRGPEVQDPHTPELIRYVRKWTYPTNTVEPTTGVPSSAAVWSIAERADKDRLFTEPGFIFGCQVCRPKIYLSKQKGNAAALMDDAFRWLPAMLQSDHAISWREVSNGDGPFEDISDAAGYWIDVRDLLIYGDQFVNVDVDTATGFNSIALPTDAFQKRFPTLAMAQSLFTDQDPGDAQFIKSDGVVSLTILGSQVDTSPRSQMGTAL
jgi:hypothetical protein